MSVFTKGIYGRLAADSTLTDMLATYTDATPSSIPPIWTIEPTPGDTDLPYIVISLVAGTADDTKTTEGREIIWDVRCYTDRTGSMVLVENIAERVRTLLHRFALVITGYTTIIAESSVPFAAPVEDGIYGLIVTHRIRTEKN